MKEVARELCGVKLVDWVRKGTDWGNEKLERHCHEKRIKAEHWQESKTVREQERIHKVMEYNRG